MCGTEDDGARWRPWGEASQLVREWCPTPPNHLGDHVVKTTTMEAEDGTPLILMVFFSNPMPCVPVSFMVVPYPEV